MQPENAPIEEKKQPSTFIRILVMAGVIALMVLLFIFRDQVEKLQEYGYIGIFLISIAANATIIIPLPGIAITTAMGAIFNPVWVAVAAGLGASLGELSGYAAGFSGQGLMEKRERYHRLVNWMRTHPRMSFFIIILLSFIPNPVMDVAGMASGALKLPIWKFLTACAIGKILKMLVFAYAGHWSLSFFPEK
jgi:membrane protein YqaA with SNARE-associated domain